MATLTESQDAYDRHDLRVGVIHSDVADVILKLEAEIAALRSDLDDAHQHIGALVAACDEAHQVLWHYDLVRQPNGVDWEPVEELQSRLIAQLGASHDAARAWLRRRG